MLSIIKINFYFKMNEFSDCHLIIRYTKDNNNSLELLKKFTTELKIKLSINKIPLIEKIFEIYI